MPGRGLQPSRMSALPVQSGAAKLPLFALLLLTLPLVFTYPTSFALLTLRLAERNQTLRCSLAP